MVAVAVVAGRRREILALEQRCGVDALAPAAVLIDRQRPAVGQGVAGHALGVGVAGAAGLGHPGRVDASTRGSPARRMPWTAVAVDAGRDLRCRRAASALPWWLVQYSLLLIDPGVGPEAPHVDGIGVAAAAEAGDLGRLPEPRGRGSARSPRPSPIDVVGECRGRDCRRGSRGRRDRPRRGRRRRSCSTIASASASNRSASPWQVMHEVSCAAAGSEREGSRSTAGSQRSHGFLRARRVPSSRHQPNEDRTRR